MGFLAHIFAQPSKQTVCILSNLAIGAAVGLAAVHLLPCAGGGKKKAALTNGKKLKLVYFGIPALGEPLRLLLALGDFDWEDVKVTFPQWSELKGSSRWGQMPLLQVDGRELAQTKAIARFLAKQVSVDGGRALYPSDLVAAYEVDEFVDAFEDVRGKLVPTFSIQDQAEKESARAALLAPGTGAAAQLLAKLEAHCGTAASGCMVGSATTLADVWCFFFLNFLRCGFWDGISPDSVSAVHYPKLFAVERRVAALPKVAAYYGAKDLSKEPMYKCFQC